MLSIFLVFWLVVITCCLCLVVITSCLYFLCFNWLLKQAVYISCVLIGCYNKLSFFIPVFWLVVITSCLHFLCFDWWLQRTAAAVPCQPPPAVPHPLQHHPGQTGRAEGVAEEVWTGPQPRRLIYTTTEVRSGLSVSFSKLNILTGKVSCWVMYV